MADVIKLLSDSIANQIAAGEVVQRPSSIVKELVENAVDSGADEIKVIIKDAGRTLVQVIDNGIGMSDTDARMAFERHATSKISSANDLFNIQTKGFRGEALASIAAVAQVSLKTCPPKEQIGTEIEIHGSNVIDQKQVNCPSGSNFMVKNLFYNIPARRRFLKSNTTELKHIINEFQRIVLAHPYIRFILTHNNSTIYNLPSSNTRQRIVHVFGKNMNANLNNLDVDTSIVKLSGYVGKPEKAKRTRGEQFFFVNHRFMRHPYFHKAVTNAYERLLPPNTHPSYFIYLQTDADSIDINIHPTKTEIKFEKEREIFRILESGIKEALGKTNMMPSIDFDNEGVIDIPVLRKDTQINQPEINVNPNYNPFEPSRSGHFNPNYQKDPVDPNWQELYQGTQKEQTIPSRANGKLFNIDGTGTSTPNKSQEYILIQSKLIATSVKSGLMLIDIVRARDRILYEQFIHSAAQNKSIAQALLYPEQMELGPDEYMVIKEISSELEQMGIEFSDLGQNTVSVNTCPGCVDCPNVPGLIEELLEEYKISGEAKGAALTQNIASALSGVASRQYKSNLDLNEMKRLVDELFACENPNYSPKGKKILTIVPFESLVDMLEKS